MSEFEHTLLDYVQAQEVDSPTPNARILEALAQKVQQRGFQRPLKTDWIAIEFMIERPDELVPLPAPQFFIGDRVCWSPLPGEAEEPLEGGCVIGMKYWTPSFSATPPLHEDTQAEWQYLIYLNPNAPSRAWIQTDWAAESDLVFQEPHPARSPVTEREGIEA